MAQNTANNEYCHEAGALLEKASHLASAGQYSQAEPLYAEALKLQEKTLAFIDKFGHTFNAQLSKEMFDGR